MRIGKYILLGIVFILFSGCAGLTKNTARLKEFKNLEIPEFPYYVPSQPAEGSLWSELTETALFHDDRARRVGDIVVVKVEEAPEAALNANTKTGRSSSIGAKLKMFGFLKALAESNPRLAQDPGTDDLISATLSSSFDGKGSSDRDGYVKASIAVMVVRILPNGNLFINGKREIEVNDEIQYIVLSGIIRQQDISTSNEISSAKVADAKISYSGVGSLADKQKPGWLMRIVDHVWPF